MVLVSYDGYPFIPDEGTISAINGATVTIEQSPRLRHIWDLIDGEVIHVTDTEIVIHSPYVDFGHYRLIRLADSD